jgi:iron(III) transport system ATP-binding protein
VTELSVRALAKAFGDTPVLRGVDLDVERGTFAAVLGPSGCGKTTLLRIIAGFERPDSGTVEIDDRPVAGPGVHVPPERRRVGIVPQEGALFPHLSVADNVGFGLSRSERRSGRRVDEVLAMVGLPGTGRAMPHELSGGQQQRVAVARALAPQPSLVLLDEPFSALDAGLRAGLRADIRAALKASAATAVLVTHDQQEALSVSDLVAVVRDGRIVQAAPPTEVYGAPADIGVAMFVGETVVVDGELGGDGVQCVFGRLPIRSGPMRRERGRVQVVVRPEQLVVGPATDAPARADVLEEIFLGHDTLARLRLPGGTVISARSLGRMPASVGDVVGVTVRGEVSCFRNGDGTRTSA